MLPEPNEQHVIEARKLFIEQFRGKRVVQGFLDTYIRRLQDIEDVLWEIIDARILDNAVDAQLDTLGRLVKETRRGRSNLVFRNGIRIKIRVLRSKGRILDVIDVATLANAPRKPDVENFRYLNFQVDVTEQIGERYLADYLSDTRCASSYGNLVASDLTYAELLAFDDANDLDTGLQTFADAVSDTGLLAASAYGLPIDWTGVGLFGREDWLDEGGDEEGTPPHVDEFVFGAESGASG